ncbi:uncharacterized protein LOC141621265 [Silene latifolia]|uniref:uncharacterized protein LOC141621265 n=1 Tax=Silene latifolia TaxID=37657 RepID=UPI003D76ACF4
MKTITDNQLHKKRTSKGKAKIPIRRIADKTARQVCFSKRRSGLLKKCSKLCNVFPGTEFAAITFSVGGKPFSHGYPCFDTVINRFLNDNRQGNNSRNVVGSDKNWWEASVDDMRLEELEEFLVSLQRLQNGVVSRVGELTRVHESEIGFNPDRQLSNYYEQSTENLKVESYDFPDVIDCVDCVCTDACLSSEFTDYSYETKESFDLGPVVVNVGTLFDVIKGINFGCKDATVSPNSDNCQEFMEIIDFESVDATPDAQGSDFSSEIQRIDFGSDDETFSPQFNSQERRNSFDLSEVLKIVDAECNIDIGFVDNSSWMDG